MKKNIVYVVIEQDATRFEAEYKAPTQLTSIIGSKQEMTQNVFQQLYSTRQKL